MSEKILIKFPDGSTKHYPNKTTGLDVVKSISEGLARKTICYSLNSELRDLDDFIETGEIKFLTFEDEKGVDVFRHTSAHILAQAVLRLFPEAKLTIGPVVNEGFYYDIDHVPFKQEDLTKIELEMQKIVDEDLKITKKEMSISDAKKLFKDNKYKLELLNDIKGLGKTEVSSNNKVNVYFQGEFFDLCRGPHLPRTGMVKAFKLIKMSSAYWRADSKNKSLQRIYGISFPDKKLLRE